MKLSMTLNYSGDPVQAAATAADYERAGIDMIWVAELYSFDAISILGYLAAHTERMELATGILPIYSRTPTLTACTAAGLDAVSRRSLRARPRHVGPAGHRGLARRAVRQADRAHPRDHRHLPHGVAPRAASSTRARPTRCRCRPDQGTGLGKPLKIINQPVREDIPIYIARSAPRTSQMTAELADGWLPVFFHPDKATRRLGRRTSTIGGKRRDPDRAPLRGRRRRHAWRSPTTSHGDEDPRLRPAR